MPTITYMLAGQRNLKLLLLNLFDVLQAHSCMKVWDVKLITKPYTRYKRCIKGNARANAKLSTCNTRINYHNTFVLYIQVNECSENEYLNIKYFSFVVSARIVNYIKEMT